MVWLRYRNVCFCRYNELGNPKRFSTGTPGNYLPTDGGVILPGGAVDGTNNTVRANANICKCMGYARAPNKLRL
jgi:hypothetical protein